MTTQGKDHTMEIHAFDSRVWQLFGYQVLDAGGNKVGPVQRVWADDTTGSLKFIGLKTTWFWGSTHVIPAGDAQIDTMMHSIRVKYPAASIPGAPSHNTDVSLSSDQERKVDTYYANL
jgi:hypothetical protein